MCGYCMISASRGCHVRGGRRCRTNRPPAHPPSRSDHHREQEHHHQGRGQRPRRMVSVVGWGLARHAVAVNQARSQASALRSLLRAHRGEIRDRKVFGLFRGGFKYCPIEVIVAFSDDAIVQEEPGAVRPPEISKADAAAERPDASSTNTAPVPALCGVHLPRNKTMRGDYS